MRPRRLRSVHSRYCPSSLLPFSSSPLLPSPLLPFSSPLPFPYPFYPFLSVRSIATYCTSPLLPSLLLCPYLYQIEASIAALDVTIIDDTTHSSWERNVLSLGIGKIGANMTLGSNLSIQLGLNAEDLFVRFCCLRPPGSCFLVLGLSPPLVLAPCSLVLACWSLVLGPGLGPWSLRLLLAASLAPCSFAPRSSLLTPCFLSLLTFPPR
jgi:hypothetical protein